MEVRAGRQRFWIEVGRSFIFHSNLQVSKFDGVVTYGMRAHQLTVAQLITQAVAVGAMVWGLRIALQHLDPYREQREQVGSV